VIPGCYLFAWAKHGGVIRDVDEMGLATTLTYGGENKSYDNQIKTTFSLV
jgi:hypothetical protein